MSCTSPLTAFYSKEVGVAGKRGITFDRNASLSGLPMKLPCGQCIGCRLSHSLAWAVRCMHEKQLHSESSFVTLTFSPEHLPANGSLSVLDHQLFMKRMRKKMGQGIRFYMCGEYGHLFGRPHYHYLFFNRDFSDKKRWKDNKRGEPLFVSQALSDLWPFGFSSIGDVTLESCAYVARYIVDKITGEKAAAHYGERKPEFTCMSRKPGIASLWYDKYGKHSHLSGDHAVLEGKRVRMPRFYDNRYELVDSAGLDVLKKRRKRTALRHRKNNTKERLRVREVLALRKSALFRRDVS